MKNESQYTKSLTDTRESGNECQRDFGTAQILPRRAYTKIRPGEHPSNRTILPKIRLTGQFFFLGHPSNRTIGKFGQTYSTCNVK